MKLPVPQQCGFNQIRLSLSFDFVSLVCCSEELPMCIVQKKLRVCQLSASVLYFPDHTCSEVLDKKENVLLQFFACFWKQFKSRLICSVLRRTNSQIWGGRRRAKNQCDVCVCVCKSVFKRLQLWVTLICGNTTEPWGAHTHIHTIIIMIIIVSKESCWGSLCEDVVWFCIPCGAL